jgi:fructose-1-phosphate kinase PfkB-like protein
MLAGLIDGWLGKLDADALLRRAIACAVANALVWEAGAIDRAEVARWAERVEVEPER